MFNSFLIVTLKRDKDEIVLKNYTNFQTMRELCTDDKGEAVSSNESAATLFTKNNKYWFYHKHMIEDCEEEKANPGDKLWHIIKHMCND